jgi:hypothetical protein
MSSELAEKLFGAMREVKDTVQAVAPGLNVKDMVEEIGGRLKQAGVQGQMEMAAALFSGQSNAFVPYGPGQSPRMAEQSMEQHRSQGRGM